MEDSRDWASVVHRTSRVIAHMLMEEALDTHKDVLFDSTLASPNQQEYRDFVNQARAQGHRCTAYIARVQTRTAVERDQERAKTPVVLHLPDHDVTLHGRLVPPELIAGAEKGLQNNLNTFLNEGLFDELSLYDNDREDKPLAQQATFDRLVLPDGSTTSRLLAG